MATRQSTPGGPDAGSEPTPQANPSTAGAPRESASFKSEQGSGPGIPLDPTTAAEEETFFQSRGRQLLELPLKELAGLADRLITQAEALGQRDMMPEFFKLRRQVQEWLAAKPQDATPAPGPSEKNGNPQTGTKVLIKWLAEQSSPKTDTQILKGSQSPLAGNGRVLAIDDESDALEMIKFMLEPGQYDIALATNGTDALNLLREKTFDLVLLDLMLPEMNGYQVLDELRSNPEWRNLPVIIISGIADMDSVVRCVELGAEDFLPKPFNPVLLRTRVAAGLEKKRLRDQEQAFLQQLRVEREKSERLLLNVLPAAIADRLKQGEATIAESYNDATVLFADLAGFTQLSARVTAPHLVELLNEIFSEFDRRAEAHGVEKIKTIGDSYMVVGGLPTPVPDHAVRMVRMAFSMIDVIRDFNLAHRMELAIRVGIHSGPVVAGIIGRRKFSYDLWGDTVNVASRMESHGQVGCIHVSQAVRDRLADSSEFVCTTRGVIQVKGKGGLETFWLTRRDADESLLRSRTAQPASASDHLKQP